jgi:hypothetical protein
VRTASGARRRKRRFPSRSDVDRQAQTLERRFDVGEAALDVAPLADDSTIRFRAVGNRWAVDVQHAEVLQDGEGTIEKRTWTSNPHANHPENHTGSPPPPIV